MGYVEQQITTSTSHVQSSGHRTFCTRICACFCCFCCKRLASPGQSDGLLSTRTYTTSSDSYSRCLVQLGPHAAFASKPSALGCTLGCAHQLVRRPEGNDLNIAIVIAHGVSLPESIKGCHRAYIEVFVQRPPHGDACSGGLLAKDCHLHAQLLTALK